MQVTYLRTLSNKRDLYVQGANVTVEDRSPEEGGKPITADEIALITRVRERKGWVEFGVSQDRRYAWTKAGWSGQDSGGFLWLESPG